MKTISVPAFRDRLIRLHDDVGTLASDDGYKILEASAAADDAAEISSSEPIEGILGQTWLLCESAADHVVATTKALTPPMQPIASFTCVRAAMEVGATACWVLDRQAGVKERLSRSFALRRRGLDEQSKLIRENPGVDHGRLDDLSAFVAENVRRYGLADLHLPSATELTGAAFGNRAYYRLGSAVAHGHAWALSQVGFIRADEGEERRIVRLVKTPHANLVAYLLVLALESLTRPVWSWVLYRGGDRGRLVTLLEEAYDDFQVGKDRRFWMDDAS